MIKIHKTISLEQFKSRLPGVIDSMDREKFVDFNQDRYTNPMRPYTNYGLFPSDVYIPENDETFGELIIPILSGTYYVYQVYDKIAYKTYTFNKNRSLNTDTYWNPLWDNEDLYEVEGSELDPKGHKSIEVKARRTVSYPTLKEWWHFFNNYYDLLTNSTSCGKRSYASVAEYNLYESNKLDISLDEKFENLGGSKMYEWLKSNCFPQFDLEFGLADEWHCRSLSLQEVMTWYGWFSDKHELYGELDDCTESDNCCECEKYFRLGGNDMYNDLDNFIKNLSFEPGEFHSQVNTCHYENGIINEECKDIFIDEDGKEINYSAYINLPIQLVNSIDDMGEFTIFSTEWANLTDYRSTFEELEDKLGKNYRLDGIQSGGTVVKYNDESWIFSDGNDDQVGYVYSDFFKEGYFASPSGRSEIENEYVDISGSQLKYADDAWSSYTQVYINSHIKEFNRFNVDFYAYKGYDLIKEPTPLLMADKYNIIVSENGFVYIRDRIYEVKKHPWYITYLRHQDGEYENKTGFNTYLDNQIMLVYSEKEDTLFNPYVIINGKRKHAFFDHKNKQFFFSFEKMKCGEEEGIEIQNDGVLYVEYDDVIYKVEDNVVTISGIGEDTQEEYPIFPSYAETIEGVTFISGDTLYYYLADGTDGKVYTLEEDTMTFGEKLSKTDVEDSGNTNLRGYYVQEEDGVLNVCAPYMKFSTSFISGRTESKLSSLVSKQIASDDLGNNLPGFFDIKYHISKRTGKPTQYFAQPLANDWLDLYYKVGTVDGKLEVLSETETKTMFWGDLLKSMEFYYVDNQGNKVVSALLDVNNYTFNGGDITYKMVVTNRENTEEKTSGVSFTNLDAINAIKDIVCEKDDEGNYLDSFIDDYQDIADIHIRCDFTYYMGCIIKREIAKSGNDYKFGSYQLATESPENYMEEKDGHHFGVEYKETAILIPKNIDYYLDTMSSYLVQYYELNFNLEDRYHNDYNDAKFNVQMAEFRTTISAYDEGISPFSEDEYMEDNSGFVDFPVLRLPYKFGSSSLQKLEADIYIDRGVNQAIDKTLKLFETKTFEALEQYSNGLFNIIES